MLYNHYNHSVSCAFLGLFYINPSLLNSAPNACENVSVLLIYCGGITKTAFTSKWIPLESMCTNPQISYNWWTKTPHSLFLCVPFLKSLLGFSASGAGWIEFVNRQGGKTLATTALREIATRDVCQTWEVRRILYIAPHINHFFDPTSYRIPWQWMLLICEPMRVKSLRPWGDSPLWRAGKYL